MCLCNGQKMLHPNWEFNFRVCQLCPIRVAVFEILGSAHFDKKHFLKLTPVTPENNKMPRCRRYYVREKLWLFGDLQSGNFFPTQSWSSRLFRTYIEFQTLWYLQLAPAQNSLQIYHSFTFPMHSLYTSYNQRTIASKVNLYPQWLGQIAEVIKVLLNIHKSVICGPAVKHFLSLKSRIWKRVEKSI